MHQALVQTQHVPRRQHDPHGRNAQEERRARVGAEHDQVLAGEAVEAREAKGGEYDQNEDEGEARGASGKSSQLLAVARPGRALQVIDDEEQSGDEDAVVHHLQRPAGKPGDTQARDTQQDEVHVAEAQVGDEALTVGLAQGQQGAIDDSGRGQCHQVTTGAPSLGWQEPQRHSVEAVRPKLGDDAGQNHHYRRRRRGVFRRRAAAAVRQRPAKPRKIMSAVVTPKKSG